MTNHARLDNIEHKNLYVKQFYAAEYGDNVGAIITFPTEYSDVQREYPIMLRKDKASNCFRSVAMLGLTPDENLFLQKSGQGWNAHYIPAALSRGPFSIGYEDQTGIGGKVDEPVVHIDMDDPRVNTEHGKPVFMPHGGNTPYLDSITTVLHRLHEGLNIEKKMLSTFDSYGLIEPIAVDIELVNGDKLRIEGQYTINHERLLSLEAQELFQLNQAGFLQGAFLILNSVENINRLIALKNAQIAA